MAHNWFEWYQVQEGDTLSGIALWWYGNGSESYWRRIWMPNRRLMEDPDQIFPGQQLKLPFWGFWYSIGQGDTLFQLAEWVYGDGNSYWIITQANPGGIQDPDQIFPNQWIWIP